MDSHSRSASPREPMRPQHRPPSPPASPGAFDNRAYTHDEDPNHNDSFTSNGPHQNGHSKEPNGDTKLPEAVNLELINLTPKNGTKKKDVEVDMNTSNPYDEYFVPVNEHRKFMRGEKLYVTADKRGEKGGCKRPLCWTLLVLVAAAVVALIVLAATGVLFSSSPTPLEQYNTSISSARAFGAVGGNDHDHDHENEHGDHENDHGDHEHDQGDHEHDHGDHEHDHGDIEHGHGDQDTTTMRENGPEQNDEPSLVSDENDTSLYVPRTVEGELTIDNEEYSAALEDPESAEYRQFVSTFTDGMKKALFDRNTLENGDNDVIIEVIKLRKGSVVVTYRIHWKPKMNTEPTPELLTAKSLKTKLDEYLSTNNRMINVYHVYEGNTPTKPVLDICQIDNNQCEYGCEFDEVNLEFTCTCPHGQIFDMINPKKCMSILENTYPLTPNESTEHKEVKVLQTDTNSVTTRPVPQEENPAKETKHVIHDNIFDWKESHHALPETTTLNNTDLNSLHVFGQGNEHNTPVHENADASPEPTAEPTADHEPTAEPKGQPEPIATNSESDPNTEPEPAAEPKPELSVEPKAGTEQTVEHNVEFESRQQSTVETEAEREPTAEPETRPEPTVEPKAEPEPTTEIKGESDLKTIYEHEIGSESKLQATVKPKLDVEPAAEPTPVPEPTAEPKSEPPITEPEPVAEPKPALEQYEEHTLEHETTAEVELNTENKPSFEIDMEPNAETDKEKSEPETTLELKYNSGTVRPRLEPITESPNQETLTENTLPDQYVSGLEVIHNIPSKNTEFPFLDTYAPMTTSEPRSQETDAPVNIHEILDKANSQGSKNELEVKTNKPVMMVKDIFEHQTERADAKSLDETEKATLRVSISEPHIINEPSYEPKPEIISIFNEKNEDASIPKLVTEGIREPTTTETTTHSEWLENNLGKDINRPTDLENIDSNSHNYSEQRSFKTMDIFTGDTTTEKPVGNYLLSGPMPENNESEIAKNDNVETNTHISGHFESKIRENTESMPKTNSVIYMPELIEAEVNAHNESTINNEMPQISIVTHEGQSLDSTTSSAIIVPTDTVREYSITDQFNSSEAEKHLIDALISKNVTKMDTTTKTVIMDDGMDITFDTINMLYNRSSHSIKINKESKSDVTDSIITETTTVSDWLSEPVTEMKFEAINNIEKQGTTETSNTKIDDIIDNGVTRDDFEPDYLNNMSTNNNKMKEDIPLYGITHDYDSEDPRVKRVNEEKDVSKEMSTMKMINEGAVTESSSASHPLETTTITEYIYKTAQKVMNNSYIDSSLQYNPDIVSFATTTSSEKSYPAPVWENSETDLSVKKLEFPIIPTHVISNDEVIVTTTPTVISAATDESVVTSNSNETQSPQSNMKEASNSDVEPQTNSNNLNVTIYEISSHNRNNSFAITNQHSAEFEDHETEMNPFLPEVENNKSLVKKLQEGHDIEPTIFNETQNDNTEDRSNNTSEIVRAISKVEENKNNFTAGTASIAEYATFGDFMKSNTPNIDADTVSENSNDENSDENKPVHFSTFLLDTDDLDKKQTLEHKTTIAENNVENGAITPPPASPVYLNDDSDYLSVVPIEEERLEERESLKKDYGSELNDISDSPKKSDRRTLDETKFGTVNDNEA